MYLLIRLLCPLIQGITHCQRRRRRERGDRTHHPRCAAIMASGVRVVVTAIIIAVAVAIHGIVELCFDPRRLHGRLVELQTLLVR